MPSQYPALILAYRSALISSTILASCIMASAPSLAQAENTKTSASTTLAIEEIVVTAEKREVNLQKLSSAVTVFDDGYLDRQNITSAVDLSSLAPGLTIAKSEGFRRIVVIRGAGLEANQSQVANASVSYHIDGVYIPSDIALNADFLDIERIEILRGPQGTVFGQNSIGGAINVITKQPQLNAFEGQADVTIGSFDHVRTRAAVNVPINDFIAARASFSYLKHDGFSRNLALPGTRLDEEDNFSGRLQILLQPSDRFSATLRAQFFTMDVNDRALKNIFDPTPDPRKLRQDFLGLFEFRSEVYNAELAYDLDFAVAKSITSYQNDRDNKSQDNDRSDGFFQPADIIPDSGRNIETITQELNITSSGDQGIPLDWIVGFFYLNTETDVRFIEFGDFNFDGVINTTVNPANPFSNPDLAFQTSSTVTRESWSVYAQGTIHIMDDLRLVGGVRFTDDEVNSPVFNFFASNPLILTQSDSAVTGKVGVEFDIADDNLMYATWTRGFKPGGTNLAFGQFSPPTFESETISAVEIGSKNRFFNDRIQANIVGFYYDYENLQFQNTDPLPFVGGVDNIPKSEVLGVEAELSFLVADNFRLDANFSYLDAEVDSDVLVLDTVAANNAQNVLLGQGFGLFSPEVISARAAAIQNINGNTLPKSPDFSTTINASYQVDVSGYGSLTTNVQYTFRDKMNFRLFGNAVTDRIPSYDLWNVSVRWQPDVGDWALEFVVINIEDDDAISARFTDTFGVGATSDELFQPRQFLLRGSYRF